MLGARAWLGRVLLLPRAGAGLAASRRCPGVWPRTWPHRSPSRPRRLGETNLARSPQ
ncbi:SPATA20 isoform 20 [Pan troglodytes]|uniref:Spermatogenesis associated 20 n=3 Tax=Hominidae TaxID=9604 RepID=D6RC70_HUMAN|nr:spermatogenesis associated 20 [Homo sapiens]KAI4050485.1 spermatogenesis associated 20 [Homo sapiens]PNI58433.1 SPATA20 isoform 20 [Pan troglodytes]PNJ66092.1 SPATA20 isoform 20 [Pongo abelii]